jgi:hypothetical protein
VKGGESNIMVTRKWLKPDEFKKIKALLDAKVPGRVVEKVTGRSYHTVTTVGKVNSIEEYRQKVSTENKKFLSTHLTPTQKTEPTNGKVEIGSVKAVSEQLNTIISLLKAVEFNTEPKGFFRKGVSK